MQALWNQLWIYDLQMQDQCNIQSGNQGGFRESDENVAKNVLYKICWVVVTKQGHRKHPGPDHGAVCYLQQFHIRKNKSSNKPTFLRGMEIHKKLGIWCKWSWRDAAQKGWCSKVGPDHIHWSGITFFTAPTDTVTDSILTSCKCWKTWHFPEG